MKSLLERVKEARSTLDEVQRMLRAEEDSERTRMTMEVSKDEFHEKVIPYLERAAKKPSSIITFQQSQSVNREYWLGDEAPKYKRKGPVTLTVQIMYRPSEESDEDSSS